MKFSQQMAAASVSLTPLISVVTAFRVDAEPCAQTNRSLPVLYIVCSNFVSPLVDLEAGSSAHLPA